VRLTRGLIAVGLGAVVSLTGAVGVAETSAQECHYAYGAVYRLSTTSTALKLGIQS
jgi:hypothetical protein